MNHKGRALKTYKSPRDAQGVSCAFSTVPCTTNAVLLPSMGTEQVKWAQNGQNEAKVWYYFLGGDGG